MSISSFLFLILDLNSFFYPISSLFFVIELMLSYLTVNQQELPQESSRFARVDRAYMKTMKKAVEVRNVMQVFVICLVFHVLFYLLCYIILHGLLALGPSF